MRQVIRLADPLKAVGAPRVQLDAHVYDKVGRPLNWAHRYGGW
ncbi:hypothetical protein ACFC08_17030 [Streptomyces sp. NPDC056112]|nr:MULTISPECIES: hypothetical protein [unclassified Streptomyces]